MLLISSILILIGSLGIIYEDWKNFEIHIAWYTILFIGIFLYIFWYYQPIGFTFYWHLLGVNLLLIFFILLFISLWVSIKKKKFQNIFKEQFGLGDFLSLFLFSFWFPTHSLLLIIITSCVLGLVIETFRRKTKIPLATYLSMASIPVHFLQITPHL